MFDLKQEFGILIRNLHNDEWKRLLKEKIYNNYCCFCNCKIFGFSDEQTIINHWRESNCILMKRNLLIRLIGTFSHSINLNINSKTFVDSIVYLSIEETAAVALLELNSKNDF